MLRKRLRQLAQEAKDPYTKEAMMAVAEEFNSIC